MHQEEGEKKIGKIDAEIQARNRPAEQDFTFFTVPFLTAVMLMLVFHFLETKATIFLLLNNLSIWFWSYQLNNFTKGFYFFYFATLTYATFSAHHWNFITYIFTLLRFI